MFFHVESFVAGSISSHHAESLEWKIMQTPKQRNKKRAERIKKFRKSMERFK